MTILPNTLDGWKTFIMDALEEARCAPMSDADRDVLVEFVREHAERIYFGPSPPSQEPEREVPWESTGYRTERREADDEGDIPF
jgi:hypothetical protein